MLNETDPTQQAIDAAVIEHAEGIRVTEMREQAVLVANQIIDQILKKG